MSQRSRNGKRIITSDLVKRPREFGTKKNPKPKQNQTKTKPKTKLLTQDLGEYYRNRN